VVADLAHLEDRGGDDVGVGKLAAAGAVGARIALGAAGARGGVAAASGLVTVAVGMAFARHRTFGDILRIGPRRRRGAAGADLLARLALSLGGHAAVGTVITRLGKNARGGAQQRRGHDE
jgi:hypothetical protein